MMNGSKEVKIYKPEEMVKSCKKLEAGLRFGQEGVSACALGPFQSPIYWTAKEAAAQDITKEMLIKRRREVFDMLNDDHSETPCKGCQMVYEKPFKDVDFSRLGHIDFSETSLCNIRCDYCYYTKADAFNKSNFDSLKILKEFSKEDVLWDSAVDFGGGEPTILPNFDECIDYFKTYGTRVFLYTNGAKYSQAAYDGLLNGNISWLCVSLDCGTPSTYLKTKQRDYFARVMENLFKYVDASKKGRGHVSVKYIFTEHNCGNDDLYGFALAMKALQPDKIWLTFDFEPTKGLAADTDDFGEFDYSPLIAAYVKLYILLKEYDMNPGHFEENHLSQVSKQGQVLLQKVKEGIAKHDARVNGLSPSKQQEQASVLASSLDIESQRLTEPDGSSQALVLSGKKVLIAPVSQTSVNLVNHSALSQASLLGFVDRDPIFQSKKIHGLEVMSYESLADINADIILLSVHSQHREDIINTLKKYSSAKVIVVENRI